MKSYIKDRILIITVILLAVLVLTVVLVSILSNKDENQDNTPPPQGQTAVHNQTINDVVWHVTYKVDTKEIVEITSIYNFNENTSSFAKLLQIRYGDNDARVRHEISLKGTPLGDNWFQIEKREVLKNWFDWSEIMEDTTIRWDEKLIFTIL